MDLQNWQRKANKLPKCCALFAEPFHVLTVTLFSLSIPLSFLLLARLSCYYFIATDTFDPQKPSSSFLFSSVLYANSAILYLIVSIVGLATLVHSLTGGIFLLSDAPSRIYRPCLRTAWITLCILQFCVGSGIEESIAFGIEGYSFRNERSLLSRIIFFLGLHETMLLWSRAVVKPIIDDTVFGVSTDETWVQRVAMALAFGTLWWCRLRDEVDSLVIIAGAKIELVTPVSVWDLIGWWLYYLTVTIGMVRVVKGLMWVGTVLLCRRVRDENSGDPEGNEEKV
ncbi:hypothetical protein K2173_025204 [Erythroxylum novogranatense]|uniref:Transmembrane protein n=1 Tax=Erythroxylum novogranatense TaxID=1862640 RepID=A0AAV8UGT7_9ROSI|nr:hypothetical protein K2173_025204 [Erythroxylum novogranatense]